MVHSSSSLPISLPVITDVPHEGFNSDDSDEEVVSRVHSVHTTSAVDAAPTSISSTTPADRPISPTPGNLTLIAIPKGPPLNPTIRILQPTESDRGTPHSSIRPWTGAEDQELINISKMTVNHARHGSRSGPDYDVTIRNIRWNILKQMSDHHGTEYASARTRGRGLNNCGKNAALSRC